MGAFVPFFFFPAGLTSTGFSCIRKKLKQGPGEEQLGSWSGGGCVRQHSEGGLSEEVKKKEPPIREKKLQVEGSVGAKAEVGRLEA